MSVETVLCVTLECLSSGLQDLPSADEMMQDVVANIEHHGICEHFINLFRAGPQGRQPP